MKIAIFYHCLLNGGSRPIDTDWAFNMVSIQVKTLEKSGLLSAAQVMVCGVAGSDSNVIAARSILPEKSECIQHSDLTSEIPTLQLLRDWIAGHEDWYVFYHHTKGVTYPAFDAFTGQWRRCMESVCIWNWRSCVADMDAGIESVGAHWLTPEKFGNQVGRCFWGGNFWWAKASFLKQIPTIEETLSKTFRHETTGEMWKFPNNRFLAESWIGTGRRPIVKDYRPHWPSIYSCDRS